MSDGIEHANLAPTAKDVIHTPATILSLSFARFTVVGTMTTWKDTAMVMPANPTPNYPTTVDEAVDMIVDKLTDAQKDKVRKILLADLYLLHFSLGTVIRNQCGLWEGNTALLAACGSPYMHPDEASNVIVRAIWDRLRG